MAVTVLGPHVLVQLQPNIIQLIRAVVCVSDSLLAINAMCIFIQGHLDVIVRFLLPVHVPRRTGGGSVDIWRGQFSAQLLEFVDIEIEWIRFVFNFILRPNRAHTHKQHQCAEHSTRGQELHLQDFFDSKNTTQVAIAIKASATSAPPCPGSAHPMRQAVRAIAHPLFQPHSQKHIDWPGCVVCGLWPRESETAL